MSKPPLVTTKIGAKERSPKKYNKFVQGGGIQAATASKNSGYYPNLLRKLNYQYKMEIYFNFSKSAIGAVIATPLRAMKERFDIDT